jgi:hypothetical protein
MRSIKILVLVAFVALAATAASAEPTYIGAAKCKMCHKVAYTSWEGMAHAKAFDNLKTDEEKANPQCLSCHATGKSADFPGVQCEACHGPGSEYKSMKTMKDREASVAAGLIIPNENTCKGCHVGEAPHDLPAFDYATAKEKGVHEMEPDK